MPENLNALKTLPAILNFRSVQTPESLAYKEKSASGWTPMTWAEVSQITENIAASLIELGINKNDKVGIFASTKLKWALSDFGVLRAAAVSVGVYPSLLEGEISYILNHAEAKVLFVENEERLNKILNCMNDLPNIKNIILWEGNSEIESVINWESFLKIGETALKKGSKIVEKREIEISENDTAIMVFTSGTTGNPKAACLTHKNILSFVRDWRLVREHDRMVVFLPMAHVGERVGGQYMRLYYGASGAFVPNIKEILNALLEIKPNVFGSVPRIFEKIYTKAWAKVEDASPVKKRIFNWAVNTGISSINTQNLNIIEKLKLKLADKLVLSKIRALFGGEVRYCVSAGAPIDTEILNFFAAAGLPIMEGYGQTEATCFVSNNTLEEHRYGSVGKIAKSMKIKIASDGEILLKGDLVFKGYYRNLEATKNTISEDGWLASGDIGSIDEDGYLWITGRKKDILITSGGKNITPSNIERLLESHSLIDKAVVYGDRKKYLVALLSLDLETFEKWKITNKLNNLTLESALDDQNFKHSLDQHISASNSKLPSYETIKNYNLFRNPLSLENGELTPTLKVKRNVVFQKYDSEFNSLYLN